VETSTNDRPDEEVLTQDLFEPRGPAPETLPSTDRVAWETVGSVLVATVHGMIEASSLEEIDAAVEARLAARPASVLFDLGDVDYVSSAGWGIFATYYERVSGWHGRVALCGMSSELSDIFRYLEFHSFMASFATRDDALADLLARGGTPGAGADSAPSPRERDLPGAAEDSLHHERESADLDDVIDRARRNDARGIDKEMFVDFDKIPTLVDLGFGTRDATGSEDETLRDMGWEKYGKELRKQSKKRKADRKEEDDES
jgi:anti-sigma B factor antagonist